MKANAPILNQAAYISNESMSYMVRPCADLVFPYHMHPDYQLNYIIAGKGKRVIGDHTADYTPGDLVLLGPNLPHYWTYDEKYKQKYGDGKAIILHFDQNFAGNGFLHKNETRPILVLLSQSNRGIQFFGGIHKKVTATLRAMNKMSPLNKLIALLTILSNLSQTDEKNLLAGAAYSNIEDKEGEIKINRIIHFMSKHFSDPDLNLTKMAGMASMSETSFSKYFRKITGRNFIDTLTDHRLSNVCKLLIDSDLSISHIAAQCGFTNLSNFNKLFKKHYHCSPKGFRQLGINNYMNQLHR